MTDKKEGEHMAHPGGRPRKIVKVTDIPEQDYFTVAEVAAMTGSHIHTIQARLRDGTLAGKKLGKHWRIYRESLLKEKVVADLNIENGGDNS